MSNKRDKRHNRVRLTRILIWLVASLAVLVAATLGLAMFFEWRPPRLLDTPIFNQADEAQAPARLRVLTWNIGYAGLGDDADFFMDGGKQVRPSRRRVEDNLQNIVAFLSSRDDDLILLQEVDSPSKRTHGVDEVAAIRRALPRLASSRAVNFKVPFVPVPLRSPMGQVESGLLSLSRHRLSSAVRHQLPGDYAWPVRVFHLKRCAHELRIPAPDGKDWVVFNLHLSAFDKGGELRQQQMAYLRKTMLERHAQGHHVVLVGDFNQSFPGLDGPRFAHRDPTPDWSVQVPADWLPEGWRWVFDDETPSLRANNRAYEPGGNFVTSVDGMVVSPDIEVERVRCLDLGFAHSDHNPVEALLILRSSDPRR